jgi:exosome complex component RRP4
LNRPEVYVRDREIVIPGQKIAKGMTPGDNVYIDKEGFLRSALLGLASLEGNKVDVIPLASAYIPKVNDLVVGKIEKISGGTVLVDINSPFAAVIVPSRNNKNLALEVGDVILAKVKAFDGMSSPLLTLEFEGLGKISGCVLLEIDPAKVPRVIGRRGSMLNILSSKTGSEILVAQNGFVVVKPRDRRSLMAIMRALEVIQEESHISGLSDRISKLLDIILTGGS